MNTKLDLIPGCVQLHVHNLKLLREFYTEVLGLTVVRERDNVVELGIKTTPLLILNANLTLARANESDAGLYHFAILFESRGDLARTLSKVLRMRPELFSGSADHLVSEAFYLNDPEGNGIELYFDREKTMWEWDGRHIKMASIYLDPNSYLEEYVTLEEENSSLRMGHFHLKVGNIQEAKRFYVDVLGFDVTAEYPGALFLSVGGYHHHVGLNTWESKNAGKRAETLGLKAIEFLLPNLGILESVEKRLQEKDIEFQKEPNSLRFRDPWSNMITMTINV